MENTCISCGNLLDFVGQCSQCNASDKNTSRCRPSPNSLLVVFGPADPEQVAAEKFCKGGGFRVCYAAVNGVRCHPGNAYKADSLISTDGKPMSWQDVTHVFECAPVASHETRTPMLQAVFDHHRPGDPGYGLPPEKYWEASSLGQLVRCLRDHEIRSQDVSDEWRFIAAADHCLGAAYKGQCPGVDPDALMQWRAESRAKFQKRSVAEVLADVENARRRLREAIADQVAKSGYGQASEYISNGQIRWDNGSGYMEVSDCDFMGIVADLRGEHVPELPEASAREGIPFLASMTDRDGRRKVSIMGAGENIVRKFLAGELVAGLVDMYGCEKRGFAGGYIK